MKSFHEPSEQLVNTDVIGIFWRGLHGKSRTGEFSQ